MILVYANSSERAMKCADLCHNFDDQPNLFGKETKKLLFACQHLFRISIRREDGDQDKLLRKIYGIANRHGCHIDWWGNHQTCCEPDRYEVYKNGQAVALISV